MVDRLIVRRDSAGSGEADGEPAEEEEASGLRFVAERRSLYDVRPLETDEPADDPEQAAPAPIRKAKRDHSFRQRVADSVETTLKLGNGTLLVSVIDGEERLFSEKFACVYCGQAPWKEEDVYGIPPAEQAHVWERFHQVPGVEVRWSCAVAVLAHLSRVLASSSQQNLAAGR